MEKKECKMKDVELITAKIREITEKFPYYGYRKVYAILKFKEGMQVHEQAQVQGRHRRCHRRGR